MEPIWETDKPFDKPVQKLNSKIIRTGKKEDFMTFCISANNALLSTDNGRSSEGPVIAGSISGGLFLLLITFIAFALIYRHNKLHSANKAPFDFRLRRVSTKWYPLITHRDYSPWKCVHTNARLTMRRLFLLIKFCKTFEAVFSNDV